MCHDTSSRPPAPPRVGTVGSREQLTLVAADGNRFSAYQAKPVETAPAGVVVLPDVRGLHPYYVALAERFAEAGLDCIAIDYFGRTAGLGERDDEFDWEAHLGSTTLTGVAADAAAAVAQLRAGDPDLPVFTVGFCFGGSNSWLLATTDVGITGAIGFYGQPARLADRLDDVRRPLLMLVAGDDFLTPLSAFEETSARLTELGKPHDMHVYDGAPHSFFDRQFAQWQDACADAWQRILAFVDQHSG